jgi:hypothetical protein
VFHGVARPSLEWNPSGEELSPEDYGRMASWGADVVRIALNQGFWLPGSSVHAAGYAGTIERNVRWAEQAGLDVILDLHWSDRGDPRRTPAQERMADARSVEMWKQVATRYRDDGRVLFELYNEPRDIGWDVWQNGGPTPDGYVAAGMQQLVDAVRSTGAQNLVLVGGLDWAFDLSGVPTHRIRGENVVYVTHPYDKPNKRPGNWDAAFGFLAASAPVVATEFGDTTCSGTAYYSSLIAYAEAKGIGWTGWAWYPGGCNFPSLIADWSGTPTPSGQVVKAALLRYAGK